MEPTSTQPTNQPDTTPPQPTTPEQPPSNEVFSPKKSRKVPYIIFITVLLLLGVGTAVWAMQQNKKEPVATTPATASTASTQTKTTQLDTIPYSFGDTITADAKLFSRPATGGDKTAAGSLGDKNTPTIYETYNNTVFVTTAPANASKDGPIIWYSNDSGKTYSKIFSPGPNKNATDSGNQITSAKFSSDGKKIIFGYQVVNTYTNTVKEIDLQTKKVTDLFTEQSAGVFLQGYDTTKSLVYYYTGCFQCDGISRTKLMVYDLSKKSEAVVFEMKDNRSNDSTTFNKAFSKILLSRSTTGEELGGTKPYTVEEYDMASKQSKLIVTVNEDLTTSLQTGYTSEGAIYYSKGDSVFRVNSSGTTDTMFQSDKPIIDVYYVSSKEVIASAGESANFFLNNYNIGTKKAVIILNGDNNTTVFGVTSQ